MDYVLTDIHFHTNLSYDAYENKDKGNFDFKKLLENNSKSDLRVGLLVKTDHNVLNYNQFTDLKNMIEISSSDLVLLPGIELNSSESVHWVFVFDDLRLEKMKDDKKIGYHLDYKIQELLGYEDIVPTMKELQEAQINKIDINKFISVLNDLDISFLAIPHLKKSKGFYEKLKKDNELFEAVQLYLKDNIINGFESRNHNEFLVNSILQTEKKIAELQSSIDEIEETEIENRVKHLQFLKELKCSIDSNHASSIYGSDFHGDSKQGMQKYEDLKLDLFYMKSNASFEGLRFALLDYDSRIFGISRMNKYAKKPSTCINEVILTENNKEKIIRLGDGLNSIIGSRGSGKSFFIKSLIGDTLEYEESDINNQVKLKKICFNDGNEYNVLPEDKYDVLNQKNKVRSSNVNIYEMLAEAPYNANKFVSSIKKYFAGSFRTENNIGAYIALFNKYLTCLKTEESLRLKSFDMSFLVDYVDYYEKQSEISMIKEKFISLESLIGKTKNKNIDNTYLVNQMVDHSEKLLKGLRYLRETKEYINNLKNQKIKSFDTLIEELDVFYKESSQVLKTNYEKNHRELQNVSLHVENISKNLSTELSNEEKSYNEKFRLLHIAIHEAVNHLKERQSIQSELKTASNKDVYDKEYIDFSIGDVKYSIMSSYKFSLFNMKEDECNQFYINYKSIRSNEYIKNLIDNGDDDNIKDFFSALDKRRNSYYVKQPVLFPQVYIKNISENSEFENIMTMSPGQRSNLLLDMILQSNTDKILILDQPEDDLDNETIFKSIVKKIRDLKLRRQVIVVTHNANIAINGDSDYIIVCQNKDNVFSFWSDKMESLENHDFSSINSNLTNTRQLEIAATILDGGKDAIRKRVKSIGYKDLFLKGD